ncbi:MAG: hypothetical protein CME68_06825 [Halobacteriovoraceae bacterium]|nr:hypothetical protein [Halobacteriovoraceae bacterium]
MWGDCADIIYFFRAIYSKNNNLPFAIIHPLKKRPTLFSNESKDFDHLPKNLRFKSFMKTISKLAGTFHLGANETYPIKINKIRPGDIYIFQLTTKKKRKIIRHAMGIKKVHPNGTMDYIYSSPRIKIINELSKKKTHKKSDLIYKKMQDPLFAPKNKLRGFRRFIWPRHMLKRRKMSISLKDSWLQQSKMAQIWGEDKFLKYVKKTLTKKEENIEITIKRKINDLCQLTNQRIEAVQEALDYKYKIKGRCFNYREYDIYSSPMMDYVLKKNFNYLRILWSKKGREIKDEKTLSTIKAIFSNNNKKSQKLYKVCPLKIRDQKREYLNLGQIYYRLKKGLFSPNPNHSLKKRWGIDNSLSFKSKCRIYY